MNHTYYMSLELFDVLFGFSFKNHIAVLGTCTAEFNQYFQTTKDPRTNPKHLRITNVYPGKITVELQTRDPLKPGREGNAFYKFSRLASVKAPFNGLISGHRLFTTT